ERKRGALYGSKDAMQEKKLRGASFRESVGRRTAKDQQNSG
ncbi:MAG: hypothetical protein ACI9MR_000683, partial [Myxococcota bacterium]